MSLSAQTPLIVIDLQTDMFSGSSQPPIHHAEALIGNTRQLLAWARATGRPVAFVRHDGPPGDTLAPDAPGWPVWPALGQLPEEPTFGQAVGDAFTNPDLLTWVAAQQAQGVVLAGAQTDFCILASTRGGLSHGLAVTVVGDAHSTWATEGESADAIILRHNALFQSLGAAVMATAALTAR